MSRDTLHPNRLAALPKGSNHWNYNANPNKLTMHRRIHRAHGAASKQLCVNCNNRARDWSLNGTIYTDKVEDYSPRCRSCHTKYDMTPERNKNVSIGLKKAYANGTRQSRKGQPRTNLNKLTTGA